MLTVSAQPHRHRIFADIVTVLVLAESAAALGWVAYCNRILKYKVILLNLIRINLNLIFNMNTEIFHFVYIQRIVTFDLDIVPNQTNRKSFQMHQDYILALVKL